jgi:predicted transcriptional regulator
MATDRANDLRAFRGFIDEQLADAESNVTLDEALARWEYENATEEEREETLKAIRRGLDDANAGRTVDAFEFVERMRQKIPRSEKS